MSFLRKFSNITKAKSEIPDIQKYISDLKNKIGQLKAISEAVTANEKRLLKKITDIDELEKKYDNYAIATVKTGNENHIYFAQKQRLDAEREELKNRYNNLKESGENMRRITEKFSAEIENAEKNFYLLKNN